MKIRNSIFLIVVILSFFSCKEKELETITANFYHWKINATLSKVEQEALKTAKTNTVFLHYFDVVKADYNEKPVAVIRKIDESLKDFTVVPVVFIRNSVFKNENVYIDYLARKVIQLTTQIHEYHFKKPLQEIQIDCDWTGSTKEKYFEFLTLLKQKLKVSVTIRLHQLKYANQTGIPPVENGSLMVYNVGDLKNTKENSILQANIVSQYITPKTTYPLALDLALPIFSQVVIINNEGVIKLINQANFDDIRNDSGHFKKESETVYKVIKKLLYKGQYLYEGFTIKLEESTTNEIVKSAAIIKNSQLNIRNTVLYHLDDMQLQQVNLKELLHQLQ